METYMPWVEQNQSRQGWRAIFACQIGLQSFEEVQKLRWGFNAAALLGEALDRQKLFIESQFHGNSFEEPQKKYALTLRCTRLPGQGLLLALIGRVEAPRKQEAREQALEYCHELLSTFPYDYKICPATDQQTFDKLTGRELLDNCRSAHSMAQILRFENPFRTQKGPVYIVGCWQTSDRADEQIWRILGNYPDPVMLNISLQPAILQEEERQFLWDMKTQPASYQEISPIHSSQPFDKWVETFIERRLNPWKRYYLMHVHVLSPTGVTDSLTRPIGAALTREGADLLSPGFLALYPPNETTIQGWRAQFDGLEITPVRFNQTVLSRLSDLADLNEVHSVFRFPYPPNGGLPGVTFIAPGESVEP